MKQAIVKQTVKVVHRWNTDPVTLKCKIEGAKPIIQTVDKVYISGKVRTSSGDLWDIAPNSNTKEADFITVQPPRFN